MTAIIMSNVLHVNGVRSVAPGKKDIADIERQLTSLIRYHGDMGIGAYHLPRDFFKPLPVVTKRRQEKEGEKTAAGRENQAAAVGDTLGAIATDRPGECLDALAYAGTIDTLIWPYRDTHETHDPHRSHRVPLDRDENREARNGASRWPTARHADLVRR